MYYTMLDSIVGQSEESKEVLDEGLRAVPTVRLCPKETTPKLKSRIDSQQSDPD